MRGAVASIRGGIVGVSAAMKLLPAAGVVNKPRHCGAVEGKSQHSEKRDQTANHDRNTESVMPTGISHARELHSRARVPPPQHSISGLRQEIPVPRPIMRLSW